MPSLSAACHDCLDDRCLEAVAHEHTDLSWMQALSNCAYWDPFTTGPGREALARLRPGDVDGRLALPEPSYVDLVLAARIRLATARSSETLGPAIRETRHLARLVYSTESFSGAMSAISILTAETRHRAKLGQLAEGGDLPPAIPEAPLTAARRAVLAYESFFSPLAPRSVRARIFTDPQLHFARCQALASGVRDGIISRRFLEAPLIFARDYRADYAAMSAILDGSRAECRLRDDRRQWAASAAPQPPLSPVVRLSGESIAASTLSLDIAYGR